MNTQHTAASAVGTRFSLIFLPLALVAAALLFYGYKAAQELQTGHLDPPRRVFALTEHHAAGQRFQETYPDAWEHISTQAAGRYTDANGIFTFETPDLDASSIADPLKIVSFTPAEAIQTTARKISFWFFAPASMLLVLLTALAWSMKRAQMNPGRDLATAELLAAHEELKRKNAQLAHLNASKDKFFLILAKDLQTPITRALDLVHFTAENLDFFGKEEYQETTETLLSSLENLRELLKNLFTWSGIQRGTLTPHLQTVDLGSIVKRNTSLLLPVAEDKQIIFKNSVPEETFIYADPNMVYAVVRNLVSNALKFSFPDDSVTIACVQHEHEVELAISDSGVGIDAENISKLFRDDVTYQTPGTSGEEGAGLGLLLCKKLMDENGGSIQVESDAGQGTTVTCRFPCKAS